MNGILREQCMVYRQVNTVVGNRSAVVFGSTCMAQVPVAELIHCFGLNISVCNRSMEGLTVREAMEYIEDCVTDLHPGKVFLGFGDAELSAGTYQTETFFEDYRKLIDRISGQCSSKLYLVAPILTGREDFYENLKALSEETGCEYVDSSVCASGERPVLSLFSHLTHYMRDRKINLGDAMGMSFH